MSSLPGGVLHWERFPVTVSFEHSQWDTKRREKAILCGFDSWEKATKGRVRFQRVESGGEVDVSFDPELTECDTRDFYDDDNVVHSAVVVMGLKIDDGEPAGFSDLEALAQHEAGHVLGIQGHSPDWRDVMYSYVDVGRKITRRDLNTLSEGYGWGME